jgi:hypothetical protein
MENLASRQTGIWKIWNFMIKPKETTRRSNTMKKQVIGEPKLKNA